MTHITLIRGNHPATVRQLADGGPGIVATAFGNWDQILEASKGAPFHRPPDALVRRDGSEVLLEDVGEEGMLAQLNAIEPSEKVTVVQRSE